MLYYSVTYYPCDYLIAYMALSVWMCLPIVEDSCLCNYRQLSFQCILLFTACYNNICVYLCMFYVIVYLGVHTVCPEKSEPPKHFALTSANMPVLNKIKHALAQKYLSYCRQISYDSIIGIIPFNRFSIFTNCCHIFQLPT